MQVLEQSGAYAPLTDKQDRTIHSPTDPWSDNFAVKVACADFNAAESYRTQNCDWRWRNANELYLGWVQQKFWEGTKIPRASLAVFVAFEQIESMLPKLLGAIFSDNPWFQADPVGQTTAEEAAQWGSVILDQLDRARVREIWRRSIKSALLYGNGITKLSWLLRKSEHPEWLPGFQQSMGLNGRPSVERVFNKRNITLIENRPVLDYVSIMDFYIDPNCFSPQVTDAAYTVERKLVTVEDIEALRDQDPYKVPSKETLLAMTQSKWNAQGDQTKSTSELYRLGQWSPIIDQSSDPALRRIELLEYWRDDRTVLVLNREHALLNIPNSYGFKPYYNAFYTDVLDRFYALGICDVVEGEQRLQQALLNGRLDELALSLHRPLIKKMGIKIPTYQQRVAPGRMWEAEKPREDFQFLDIPNITANAYIETQGSELRVQKITGVTDLAVLGTPSSGGNSASRTATGVGVQAQASNSRLQYLVENLEDTFVEPQLNDIVKLNQLFPPIGASYADTIALKRVRLTMRASVKMQSKMALLQTFPLVFQTLANPALVGELAMQGLAPDWMEVFRMLTDMTGYQKRADLIRKLTPEEMKARQQAQNSPDTIRMMMQRERIAGQEKIQDKRLAADMQMQERQLEEDGMMDDNGVMAGIIQKLLELQKAAKETTRGTN